MKVRIELDPSMDEPEILIRAPRLTQELAQLQESILKQKLVPLAFYKNRSEYFLDLADILFICCVIFQKIHCGNLIEYPLIVVVLIRVLHGRKLKKLIRIAGAYMMQYIMKKKFLF